MFFQYDRRNWYVSDDGEDWKHLGGRPSDYLKRSGHLRRAFEPKRDTLPKSQEQP